MKIVANIGPSLYAIISALSQFSSPGCQLICLKTFQNRSQDPIGGSPSATCDWSGLMLGISVVIEVVLAYVSPAALPALVWNAIPAAPNRAMIRTDKAIHAEPAISKGRGLAA